MSTPRQNFAQKLHIATPVTYKDVNTIIIANVMDKIAPDFVCSIVNNQNLIGVMYNAKNSENNDAHIIMNELELCMFIKLSLSILWPESRRKDKIADNSVDRIIKMPIVVSVEVVSGKNKPAMIVINTIKKKDVMEKNNGVPSNHERNVIFCPSL